MLVIMFCVSESDAAAIRQAFLEGGEFAAAVELRRRFVGISSNADARRFVRTILGWASSNAAPAEVGKAQ
ncbi:hypothetical protein [Teichococcus oryzae]|uniref:Uncharacterized protein n=1 Tax=Teichococcus oryzae TaxID=1608942 RepID=A0A5B2T975_9PROT|nr:hypothetical protein [Pseudoroseomonas oryzae]KAA2211217.1 hypothetical protein F0Q34_21300 [Pseudoroseomonas oryzae]